MKSIATMNLGELGAFVCQHLQQHGIAVVLSGRACVSIYTHNQYASYDLDFINAHFVKRQRIQAALEEIGFSEHNHYFRHPDSEYFLEFPPGPLAIGEERIERIEQIQFETGILHLLSPTDCIKDRLAGYYHWEDLQCLEQAILVARQHSVNIDEIERWSNKEKKIELFHSFLNRLKPDAINNED